MASAASHRVAPRRAIRADVLLWGMRLYRDHCLGMVIDVQQRLFPHIDGHDELAARLDTLVRGLAELGVPLLVTQQYTRGLGETIEPLRALLVGQPTFEKISFSCWGDEGIAGAIRRSGRRCVIVAGIEAHVCVLQTTLDLLAAGFLPVVVEDCVSSRHPLDRRVALERLRQEGARVSTAESLLFELLERAGTETFRRISRLVK